MPRIAWAGYTESASLLSLDSGSKAIFSRSNASTPSDGAITGIVIAVVFGVIAIAFSAFLVWRRQRHNIGASSHLDLEGIEAAHNVHRPDSNQDTTAKSKNHVKLEDIGESKRQEWPSTTDPMFDLLMNSNNRRESGQRYEPPPRTRQSRTLYEDPDFSAEEIGLPNPRLQKRLPSVSLQTTSTEFGLLETQKTPNLTKKTPKSPASGNHDVLHKETSRLEEKGKEGSPKARKSDDIFTVAR